MTTWLDVPFFALVGAPKCATTSVARALADHDQVAFAMPKEPFWFGSELRPLARMRGITSPQRYARIFGGINRRSTRIAGEATTLYLSSGDAVDQLLAARPDARIICMVRDPVDVAYAFHMQMVFVEYDPEPDFGRAWRAQADRRLAPPRACPVPRLLQYRDLASLGTQLVRLEEQVAADRLLVLSFRDYVEDPSVQLGRVAEFLDIDPDGLHDPGVANPAMRLRARPVARVLRTPVGRQLLAEVKRFAPRRAVQPAIRLKDSVIRENAERPPLPPDLVEELDEAFAGERALLADRGLRI